MNCKIILPPNDIYKLPAIPTSFDELMREIQSRLSLAGKETDSIHLKYMDAENELVTLANQEDYSTAVLSCQAEDLKTLKVHIFITESPKLVKPNVSMNFNGKVKLKVKANSENKKDSLIHSQTTENSEEGKENFHKAASMPLRQSITVNNGKIALGSQQLETIKELVGSKVMKALETNMKNLMPEFIAKLKCKKEGNTINDNVVRDLSRNLAHELNESLNSNKSLLDLSRDEQQMLSSAIINRNKLSPNSVCSQCKVAGKSVRYVCPECSDYKCCEPCEEKIRHEHPLLKLRSAENNNVNANIKGNCNVRVTLSDSPRHQDLNTSGCRQLKINTCSDHKIQYKGILSLGNNQDHNIHLSPNEKYTLTINAKNIGKVNWPENVRLTCVNGVFRGKEIELKGLETGEKKTVIMKIKAPKKGGRYLSQWRLYYEDVDASKQRTFGESLFWEMFVDEEEHKSQDPLTEGIKKNVLRMADYLNDIYPGQLEEKIDFIETKGLVWETDMCKVVEMYLQEHVKNLRGKKGSGCRPESKKLGEQFGMSLML